MPKATRVHLPAVDPGFALDQAVAARTADGIRLAVKIGASRVAIAVLGGADADAKEAEAGLNPYSPATLWRSGPPGFRVVTLDGTERVVPDSPVTRGEEDRHRWAVAGDGVLITGPTGWPALHHVTAQGRTWSIGTGDRTTSMRVSGFAVSPDGKRVFVALTDGERGVIAGHGLDGAEQWKVEVPVRTGQVAIAPDGRQVAVMTTSPRCEACLDAQIVATDRGATVRTVELERPAGHTVATLDGNLLRGHTSMGFTGDELWFHSWSPGYVDDMGSGKVPEECPYAVYDATVDKGRVLRVNSLACSVRSLIALGDGGVVALEPGEGGALLATTYDRAP